MRKTMFVLGSTGFIGTRVVVEAVAAGWEVRALVRSRDAADRLAALGAIAVLGDAETPHQWMEHVRGTEVLIDLLQPKVPKRFGLAQVKQVASWRHSVTRALVRELGRLPESERPLLVSVSGIDDLEPDQQRRVHSASPLRKVLTGFAYIGVPVRRLLEDSGIAVTFVYLGTVYGPGKSFADVIVPKLAKNKWRVIGDGRNRTPMIHVDDAARGFVHLAGLERTVTQGQSYILADGSSVSAREFFNHAASLMGAQLPGTAPVWLASLIAGVPLVQTMTRDVIADPSALLATGFQFRYPSSREGLPPTLRELGYDGRLKSPPAEHHGPPFWLVASITFAILAAENLGYFRWSVPYMLHASGNLPLLDMRFSYSASEAYQLLDALGPAGRHDYARLLQSVDLIIPLVFSWFLWAALSRGAGKRYRLLGLVGGAFDYLENIAVFILLASYPMHLNSVVLAAEMLTRLKFIGYGSGLLLAAFNFAIDHFARLRHNQPHPMVG